MKDFAPNDVAKNNFTSDDFKANEKAKNAAYLRLCVCGACGKTGGRVVALAKESRDFRLVCAVDEKTPTFAEKDVAYLSNLLDSACETDVLIDFSSVRGLDERLEYAASKGIPFVLAVTGLTQKQKELLRDISQRIPVFYASNFSIAANALRLLSASARRLLKEEFSVDIFEKHHAEKKDSPSGTAISIAEEMERAASEKSSAERVFYASSAIESNVADAPTKKNALPLKERIVSVRAGTLIGEHEAFFCGDGETLSLTHRAYDRDVFARGALKAALFLHGKPPRLYGMDDLLHR